MATDEVAIGAVEAAFRRDGPAVVAAVARRFADLDLAEECTQEAFVEALRRWPGAGPPDRPVAWLTTTAMRKALDRVRRREVGRARLASAALPAATAGADDEAERTGPGAEAADLLALVTTCCHPALPRESQVALTLRLACGLSAEEIAAGLLVAPAAVAQRLTRAKRLLRDRAVRVVEPAPDELAERLAEVLTVVYLVFNEGYLASGAKVPARHDLAATATALAQRLARLMPREPEVLGLLALLLLHQARAAARFDGWGRLVLLEEQDRTRWDRALADEGARVLERALRLHRPGPYQVQAAIAALHVQAPSWAETDWPQIRMLYDALVAMTGSPTARLGRAVATRYVDGPAAALAEADTLADALASYRLLHATRAELLHDLGRVDEARDALGRALALASNPAERELLARRLGRLPAQ